MAKLLNFRCPDDLWEAIEKIGGERHPVSEAERHHRSTRNYDLTATILDIVRAGIVTLDGVDGDQSIFNKIASNTLHKTDVEIMIHQAIANLPKPEPPDMEAEVNKLVDARVGNLKDEIITLMEELEQVKALVVEVVPPEISTTNEDEPLNYFPDIEEGASELYSEQSDIAPAIAIPANENIRKSRARRKPKSLCQEGLEALERAKKRGMQPMNKLMVGELGKSRGYSRSVDGFCQMCRADNPDRAFKDFGVVYDRGTKKYFDVREVILP